MKSLLIFLAASLLSTAAFALPTYVWDSHEGKCGSITQNDLKRIGTGRPFGDNAASRRGMVVYYFVHLQDTQNYGAPYANLSLTAIGNERYLRIGGSKVTVGNDRDLSARQMLEADFVLCGVWPRLVFGGNWLKGNSPRSVYSS